MSYEFKACKTEVEISISKCIFYQYISLVGLTLIVRNLELEIIIILVSSKIGSINDGTPETLKTKTWIRSSKSRRVIMKNILFVSKDGSPLILNFLQTT